MAASKMVPEINADLGFQTLPAIAEERRQMLTMPAAHTKGAGATLSSFLACMRVYISQF
jgi:hypothetical protein